MNRDYQLTFCKRCQNRRFDPEKGIICNLTLEKPAFIETCPDYEFDDKVDFRPKHSMDANSSKSWTILSVSVLVALVLVLVISKIFNEKEKMDTTASFEHFTEQDYINYGKHLERAIDEGQIYEMNEALNYDYLCENITSRLYERSFSKKAICKELPNWLSLGSICYEIVWDGGDFEFTKHYMDKDEIPHLVFRAYGDFSIKYMDFKLGVKNNKLILNDAFDYVIGSTYSDYFFNTLSLDRGFNVFENKQKELDSRKTGLAISKIQLLISQGNYEAAMLEWENIPSFFKDKNFMAILKLQISQGLDEETYVQTLEEYLDMFPGEKRLVDFYYMTLYSDYGNVELTEFYLANLKSAVGDDKLLNHFLGMAYYNASENKEALKVFKDLIEYYPEVSTSYVSAVECAKETGDIDYIKQITPLLLKREYYSEEELVEVENYAISQSSE